MIKFQVGDLVEVDCPCLHKKMRGEIVGIFDVLFADRSEGNLEIDIRHPFNKSYFRYKPSIDGGTIIKLERL